MVRQVTWLAASTMVFALGSVPAQGQILQNVEWRPEVFVSVGPASLTEGDSAAGDWTSLGAGATLPLFRRLAAQVEFNRMLGTAVETIGSVRSGCRGNVCGVSEPFEFRSGTSSLTVGSAGLLFYFSERRLQPFIGGGWSVLWHEGARLCAPFCQNREVDSEDFRTTETGRYGSAGLRISLSRHVSITPEVRLNGTKHYGVLRPSVAAGVRW